MNTRFFSFAGALLFCATAAAFVHPNCVRADAATNLISNGNFETDADGMTTKDIAEIIIAKHRNGPVKTVRTRFINRYAKFENLDEIGASDSYNEIQESRGLKTVKRSSRMNDEEGGGNQGFERQHKPDDFGGADEDPPF